MDSKKQPNAQELAYQLEKESKNKRLWFWIRLTATTIIIFVLWWFIAPLYTGIISSVIYWLMDMIGYYVDKTPKNVDALMSPVIPFLILMIATWGTKLFYVSKKINWRLIAWTFGLACLLFAISLLGQYVAIYMATTNTSSDFLIFLGGFLIATGPVLIPIVAWLALSHKELRDIFLKA